MALSSAGEFRPPGVFQAGEFVERRRDSAGRLVHALPRLDGRVAECAARVLDHAGEQAARPAGQTASDHEPQREEIGREQQGRAQQEVEAGVALLEKTLGDLPDDIQ